MSKKVKLASHDAPGAKAWDKFMSSGWAPSPLQGISEVEAAPFCAKRREALSKAFPGERLVIPAGSLKVRSNDTDYRFRAHSAYSYLTGISATDSVPDSVLVLEP